MSAEKRKKILVIEEDSTLVDYLRSFVPLLGPYEVEVAFDDLSAFAKLNAFEPELLVLDPDTTQLHPQQILKDAQENHQNTKVLLLHKPIDFSQLSHQLKKLLPHPEPAESESEPARLLIADDEPDIDEFLKEVFEPMGFEVYTAKDGEEALGIFNEKRCNLVFLDLKMPKVEGQELFRRLDASVNPPKPKAVFFLTSALGGVVEELKRLGHPVFTKPVDLESLQKAVLEACKTHRLTLATDAQKMEG